MYKPIKFNDYWYICKEVDGKALPVNTDQYTYASECEQECNRLNKGDKDARRIHSISSDNNGSC